MRKPHYAWVVAVTALAAVFAALGVARFGYTLVLPSMQAGLGMDNTQAGILATANLAGYLALAAAGGALASRYGPRLVLTAGLLVAAVGMIFTGLADGFRTAAVWRAVTGLGSGAANMSAMGLFAAWFGRRHRGRAAGIGVAGSSVALIVLGPLVPGLLNAVPEHGWRVCWFVYAGMAGLLAAAGYLLVRNRPADMGLAAYGGTEAPGEPGAGQLAWGRVYRSGRVWHLGCTYAAFGFSYIIFMTFFAKHLIMAGGYTKAAAGRLFMIVGWCSLCCGLIWGFVSDRIGRKWALAIVYAIQAAAFACFGLWIAPTGFLMAAVLFGLTAWSIPAIMAAACGDLLGGRMAPAALGFITLFFGLGQAAGPAVAGAMADAAGSFAPALLLAAGVALLGAAGAASLAPHGSQGDGPA
ncbi:MAG: YbfB/YjiJ family MFS transporter [Lentisphaerae bacterium]|nr:YbfB/YjiJ family MFS transporter [Lentisphaerota bacterium]